MACFVMSTAPGILVKFILNRKTDLAVRFAEHQKQNARRKNNIQRLDLVQEGHEQSLQGNVSVPLQHHTLSAALMHTV